MNFEGKARRTNRMAGINISISRKNTAPTASADRPAT
jgi:hypothetical protein